MIKNFKPTSPGARFRKILVKDVSPKRPEKSLTSKFNGAPGRSNGRISSRHKQRGAKKLYRIIDFSRSKINIPATVTAIEHDPNRGPNIALLNYLDGEKRYILSPEGLVVGMKVMSGPSVEPIVGNALPLENIPLSTFVHNIEINPGKGGQLVRGAGTSAILLAKEGGYAHIKLPSSEVKRILLSCYATIGTLGNADLRNVNIGKAGKKRYLGFRPHIRGIAIANPSDHPHGGSYKDNGIGMPSPKSPWGWKTRGKKTRKRKHTNRLVVKQKVR